MSTVINQHDTRAEMTPCAFHLVLVRVEFLYVKTPLCSYLRGSNPVFVCVIYTQEHGVMCGTCICFFLGDVHFIDYARVSLLMYVCFFPLFSSLAVLSTQQTNVMRRNCATT